LDLILLKAMQHVHLQIQWLRTVQVNTNSYQWVLNLRIASHGHLLREHLFKK